MLRRIKNKKTNLLNLLCICVLPLHYKDFGEILVFTFETLKRDEFVLSGMVIESIESLLPSTKFNLSIFLTGNLVFLPG